MGWFYLHVGNHTDGDSIYKPAYRNFHVKCSNDAVIQFVSVFAVGFADHFVASQWRRPKYHQLKQ